MLHALERLLDTHLASMQPPPKNRSRVALLPLPPRRPGPPSKNLYMLPLPPVKPAEEFNEIIQRFHDEPPPAVNAQHRMTNLITRYTRKSQSLYDLRWIQQFLGLHPRSQRSIIAINMVRLMRTSNPRDKKTHLTLVHTQCVRYIDQLNATAVDPASVLPATQLALESPQKTVYTLKLAFDTDPTLRAFCNSVIQSGTFLGADINRRVDYFVDAAFVPPVRELAFNLICMAITEGVPQYQDKFNQFLDAVMALAPGDA